MFSHTVIQSVQTPSGQLNAGNKVYSAAANLEFDEIIDAGGVDVEVGVTIPVANIQSMVLTANQDVTVKTNVAATPANTFDLKANVPYIWNKDSYDTNKLTIDVTKLFVSNAGLNPATLSGRFIFDPTPLP